MIAKEMELDLSQNIFDTFYKNSEGKNWEEKDYLMIRDRRNFFRDLGDNTNSYMESKKYYKICADFDIFLQIYEEKHPQRNIYIQQGI